MLFRLIAGAFLVLLASAQASARDYIVDRAVLEDRDGTLSIEDVTERSFAPVAGMLSRGYTDSVHWLRLTVAAPPGDDGALVLRIRPSYLDEVALFEPDSDRPGEWIRRVTGDRMPFADRELASSALGFIVAPSVPETTYYLRLDTTSTSMLHVEALEPRDASLADLHLGIFQAIFLALMIWSVLWGIHQLLIGGGWVIGWFTILQATNIFFIAALLGMLAPILPGIPVDELTSLLVCLVPMLAFVFHRALVRQFDPHPAAMAVLDGLILLETAVFVLLMLGHARIALQLNAVFVLLSAPVFVLLAVAARREAPPGLRILRSVYVLLGAMLTVMMLPLLGLMPAGEWNMHATIVYGVFAALTMFFFLHLQARQLQKAGAEAAIGLSLARQELQFERRQRDMQNRFMAMLTHELKSPLSVIKIAVGRLGVAAESRQPIDRSLDNIAAIIDRCTYADQVEQSEFQVSRETIDVGAELSKSVSLSAAPARITLAAEPMPAVTSDRQLLDVLLGNLIDNAIKYSPPDTSVEIRAAPDVEQGRAGVRIAIENLPNRAGLPDPQRVFEKFYRSAGAHGKSGAGLGLYVVRGISEMIGGRVVSETVGAKARFSLWLPC